MWKFQSTLPRGERLQPFYPTEIIQSISIHAPARGATIIRRAKLSKCFDFNPRSREGSDCICNFCSLCTFNFNPRSREGSDFYIHKSLKVKGISIHAPARGATAALDYAQKVKHISIHAPARGATTPAREHSRS